VPTAVVTLLPIVPVGVVVPCSKYWTRFESAEAMRMVLSWVSYSSSLHYGL
jgi:hypothetical protein